MRSLGEIQPGMTLGRYEFLVPIAQGGMAAVWAARLKGSRGFSKIVAVKTMLPSISDDPQFEQMFLDEAQIASGIRHPNVVQILDLGEQDDVLYLVMEWVDGEPLSSLRRSAAKKGGIPRPIAVKVIADACAGVHAAHELKDDTGKLLGLVHRDISPQNLLITYDGVVKIVDFGVAKASGRSAEATSAGQIKGKPPYMSPEQALGQEIDRRTDLFALGIILYQLTTGKHPFRGESDIVTLQNIISDRPIVPPRAYDKEYPKPLEAVVMKALERDAAKRFHTSAEFEQALDRVFPPTVPRVRTEDVGKFVMSLVGDRAEERRNALKEAIRLADERGTGTEAAVAAKLQPISEIGSGITGRASLASAPDSGVERREAVTIATPASRASGAGLPPGAPEAPVGPSLELERYSMAQVPDTPYGAAMSAPFGAPQPARRHGVFWVLGGLIVALGLIAAALVVTRGGAQAGAPAAATPVPAATTAAPKPAETAAAPEPVSTASPPTSGTAIDPSQLPSEKKPGGGAPWGKPAAGAKGAEPAASAKPAAKSAGGGKKGGWVPPPVTDPGF